METCKAPALSVAAAAVPRAVFFSCLFLPSFPHSSKGCHLKGGPGCHLQPWGPRNPDGSQQRAPPVRWAGGFPGGRSAGLSQGPPAMRDGSHMPQCTSSRWKSSFLLPKDEAPCDSLAKRRVSIQAPCGPQGTEKILPPPITNLQRH